MKPRVKIRTTCWAATKPYLYSGSTLWKGNMLTYAVLQDVNQTFVTLILLLRVLLMCCKQNNNTTLLIFACLDDSKRIFPWVKRDQLQVTCFIISLFNAQHVSDVNISILRSLRLMCWVISWVTLISFDVCWSYIVVWLWCIRMQASTCIRIPHHHSHTTT